MKIIRLLADYVRNRHDSAFKIIISFLCIVFIVNIFPKEGKFKYEYQKGKPWVYEDLIAPYDFTINKTDEELEKEQDEVIKNARFYFREHPEIYRKLSSRFTELFNNKWKETGHLTKQKYQNNFEFASGMLSQIYAKGIIEPSEEIVTRSPSWVIYVIRDNIAEEKELGELYNINSAFAYIKTELNRHPEIEQDFQLQFFEDILKHNITLDGAATMKYRKELLDNISLSREMKQKGERIISKGDLVDADKFKILESLKAEYVLQTGGTDNSLYVFFSQAMLVGICILLIVIFLGLYRKDILLDNRKFTFILLVVFLYAAMMGISLRFKVVHIYVLPYCLIPVLVRNFFDTRVALYVHLASILALGTIVPDQFEFVFAQLTAGFFGLFSIRDMHHRSQMFFTVLVVFISYLLSYTGISVAREGSFTDFDWYIIEWFGVSSLLILIVFPVIFVFEKLFGFTSEVTLMELSDINTPLLRELALKAPGTFQHSLQVANLAEEAIIAVGGNSLLVRTAALYHDIGKMEMPLYFIENQSTGINPHDELSFEESATIIIGHVYKGIEIAKQNNLPDQLIDFIRTHHGTTKAQYFYQSFLKNFPEEEIDVSVFQYPGPIPFSKETAILMMADSVEASSRSLKRYDAESLEKLVDRIIDSQIAQNQFANSDINFRDINTIKKVLKKKLQNIYHLRIEYPQ